jgi:hypothetical protein
LRDSTGLDPRPYQVTLDDAAAASRHDHVGTHALVYEGETLTPTQEQQFGFTSTSSAANALAAFGASNDERSTRAPASPLGVNA